MTRGLVDALSNGVEVGVPASNSQRSKACPEAVGRHHTRLCARQRHDRCRGGAAQRRRRPILSPFWRGLQAAGRLGSGSSAASQTASRRCCSSSAFGCLQAEPSVQLLQQRAHQAQRGGARRGRQLEGAHAGAERLDVLVLCTLRLACRHASAAAHRGGCAGGGGDGVGGGRVQQGRHRNALAVCSSRGGRDHDWVHAWVQRGLASLPRDCMLLPRLATSKASSRRSGYRLGSLERRRLAGSPAEGSVAEMQAAAGKRRASRASAWAGTEGALPAMADASASSSRPSRRPASAHASKVLQASPPGGNAWVLLACCFCTGAGACTRSRTAGAYRNRGRKVSRPRRLHARCGRGCAAALSRSALTCASTLAGEPACQESSGSHRSRRRPELLRERANWLTGWLAQRGAQVRVL